LIFDQIGLGCNPVNGLKTTVAERSGDIIGMSDSTEEDSFELWDLRVEAIVPAGTKAYCGARDGDYFEVRGEMLTLPPGQGFSIYSIAAVLPLLPAKQRPTHASDWMASDSEVACPDPNCPSRLRIRRLGLRRFRRSETTATPAPPRSAA
jgi:uncharacterized repeat protein (TIGR04076 family)